MWQGIVYVALAASYSIAQILFRVFEIGHMYENAKIIHNHAALLQSQLFKICMFFKE